MKFLLAIMMATAFAMPTKADVEPYGDGWPWPWGSECPFPWTDIEGKWLVKSLQREKKFDDHLLVISVEEADVGSKLLFIEQYDEKNNLVATGQGISEGNGRVISAIMDPESPMQRAYKVMIRSYLSQAESAHAVSPKGCTKSDTTMAVTFCSPNGKKCMQNSNYTLEKPKSKGRH